jgi:hypothetical protein
MTYAQFEDSPVWQKAAELYEVTEELLVRTTVPGLTSEI